MCPGNEDGDERILQTSGILKISESQLTRRPNLECANK